MPIDLARPVRPGHPGTQRAPARTRASSGSRLAK
jgi:hypothetical protein